MRLLKTTPTPSPRTRTPNPHSVRIETKMPEDLVLRIDEVAPPPRRAEFIRAAIENELARHNEEKGKSK